VNIFYLDKCPYKAAEVQYNKHVVKMILESAQMLCTAHHVLGSSVNIPIHPDLLRKIVYEVSMLDLDEPPKNKLRKVIFKYGSGLTKEEKLRIVGELIGRTKRIHEDDIYQCMLDIHDLGESITITKISKLLNCTTRTIHRNMCEELKREKELLNKQL
jgi:hypothetical protein